MTTPFDDSNVEHTFDKFPEDVRGGLLELREMIFKVAARTPGVGKIQETLKWKQPSYLTPETKSGSTLRLGLPKEGCFAIYTHCQTTILSDFQTIFPNDFVYEGNRAVHFRSDENLPLDRLEMLVKSALTYHLK